jgi:IstB-like ATP binding protein
MILTSNRSFRSWGEGPRRPGDRRGDLDRLLHHAITVNIQGNSYRLKEKLKAGFVKLTEALMWEPGGGEFSMTTGGEFWVTLGTHHPVGSQGGGPGGLEYGRKVSSAGAR